METHIIEIKVTHWVLGEILLLRIQKETLAKQSRGEVNPSWSFKDNI
jgi:hypothetical protein